MPMTYTLDALRVASEADHRARTDDVIARLSALGRQVVVTIVSAPLVAYVSDGRWVADCVCGAGIDVHPGWQYTCCWECFRSYSTVSFPDEVEAIETVLKIRPKRGTRNWLPGDTVEKLETDNADHGLPKGSVKD